MTLHENFIHHFLFAYYPYICLTVFFLGSLIRFDRDQYSWRCGSSELLRKKQLVIGSNLWHVGILVVLGMTVLGLLSPFSRLVHIWSAPIGYLGRKYQIVRIRKNTFT